MVGFATPSPCSRPIVCCQASSAAWARRCLLITVECAEIGGSGGLDDPGETRLQDLLRENARPDCASDHALDARFGCDESSQVCRSSDVSRSLEPNSGLACTEGCLCRAVLREARGEPIERPLPDLVVDRCGTVPPRLCGREPEGCG